MAESGAGAGATSDSAADFAAAALLGALLWHPRRIEDVRHWLEPGDFAHWGHRAIYQTLTGLIAAGQPVDLMTFPVVLARADHHDVHVDRTGIGPLSAAALHTMLAMTPAARPAGQTDAEADADTRHLRYAHLVLEASIRRQVEAAGTRIAQHARQLPGRRNPSEDPAELLMPVLASAASGLHDLEWRLAAAGTAAASSPATPPAATSPAATSPAATSPAATPPAATPPAATPPAATTAVNRARASRPASAAPPPPAELHPARVERAELALIGACLVSEDVRASARELRADDFASPATAATWTALCALMDRGDPVDFVLLAAEVEHQTGAVGLQPGVLAALAARGERNLGHRALDMVALASPCYLELAPVFCA